MNPDEDKIFFYVFVCSSMSTVFTDSRMEVRRYRPAWILTGCDAREVFLCLKGFKQTIEPEGSLRSRGLPRAGTPGNSW